MVKRQIYGLFTTIALIVGTVIGSGIFFKADDILQYTGGHVGLSLLLICLSGFMIMVSSLSLSKFASLDKKGGSIIDYYEQFIHSKVASAFGWFQLFVYFPTISTVVSWVCAIYISDLFRMDASLELLCFMSLCLSVAIIFINAYHRKISGVLQNLSTIIKLIPLALIGLSGLFFGGGVIKEPSLSHMTVQNPIWLSALIPILFSYDGWITALNLASEVKNPSKNVTRALIIGPLVIVAAYAFYFYGINTMLGNERVLELGNQSIYVATTQLFGSIASNFIMVIVIISILGVQNGLNMAGIRLPQMLSSRGYLPITRFAKIDQQLGVSKSSAWLYACIMCIWAVIHYLVTKFNLLGTSDVSEIAIVFSYIMYGLLYVVLLKLWYTQVIKKSFINLCTIILSIVSVVIIVLASFMSNAFYVSLFIFISILISMIGFKVSNYNK